MNKELEEDFRCPICVEIPQKEIFQCRNGHTICAKCCENLRLCPQCRVPFDSQKIRVRVLENVLDKMKFDCPFKDQGCSLKLKRTEILSHSESCVIGNKTTNLCKNLGYPCTYLFNPKKLKDGLKHFQTEHNFSICRDEEIIIRIQNVLKCNNICSAKPIIFDLQEKHGATWVFQCFYDHKTKSISPICVQLSENTPNSKKLRIEFTIKGVNVTKTPDIFWTTSLLPLEKSSFALTAPMFQLCWNTIYSFYTIGNFLDLHCSITIDNVSQRKQKRVKIVQTHFASEESINAKHIAQAQVLGGVRVTGTLYKECMCRITPVTLCFTCNHCYVDGEAHLVAT